MAKATKKTTTKRRVKKNVEHGQAHIQSSFNNTIVTLTDNNLLLMQHRWQQRLQQKLL